MYNNIFGVKFLNRIRKLGFEKNDMYANFTFTLLIVKVEVISYSPLPQITRLISQIKFEKAIYM